MVGDVVVAAGCIAYAGPFTPAFRQRLQQEWRALMQTAAVPHTPETNLIDTLQVSDFTHCTEPGSTAVFCVSWLARHAQVYKPSK